MNDVSRTLSAILPSYSVNVNNIWHTMGKGFYDEDLGLVVALIPKTFPSLRCLRLHNVPDLDPFFKICASLVSLRILDISFCDTVLDADVDFEDRVDEFTTSCEQIVRNTPPLEVLRIAVLFGTGPKSFFVSNRAKAIMQIISLIRASSSTLFEFSIAGNGHVYFDALKLTQMHFPRLRRLTLWSMLGNVADIRKFILVHQANLAELNLTFFCTRSYPTLSCLSRIMKGICPLEGNKAAFAEEEEKIDSLVHPEDARWGHFECDVFAYAMREGKVVELSISFPQIDIDGFEVNSNGDLRIFKLAILLGQFTHLEILTLMACRHDERDFVSLMVRDLIWHGKRVFLLFSRAPLGIFVAAIFVNCALSTYSSSLRGSAGERAVSGKKILTFRWTNRTTMTSFTRTTKWIRRTGTGTALRFQRT